jgi:uncharacterized protein YgbK (DUF1537 family)
MPLPGKIGIICHDLVAALRGTSKFVHFGLSPVVVLNEKIPVNSEIISLVPGGKLLCPRRAYQLTRKAISRCNDRFIYLYKDSLLRGNISADIRAVIDELQPEKVVFCTARPELARYIMNGTAYIGDLPLNRTLLGNDLAEPVKEAFIPAVIRKDTGLASKLIGLSDIERGPSNVAGIIKRSVERIVVCDARETHHLKTIAEAIVLGQGAWIPCGSGGLMKEMPAVLGYRELRKTILPLVNDRPIVLSIGSLDEVSALQLSIAAENGTVYPVLVEPADLWRKPDRERKMDGLAREAAERIKAGQNVAITTSLSRYAPQVRLYAASLLATVVRKAIDQQNIGGVLAMGADTAYALCKELQVETLRAKGCINEDVSTLIAEAYTRDGLSFWLGTKGGAVGDELEIIRAVKFMRSS